MSEKELIQELTPEQEAEIPVIREKWIKIGLDTGETNWDKTEKVIKDVYAAAKKDSPNVKIRVDSPMTGAICAAILASEHVTWDKKILEKEIKQVLDYDWSDESRVLVEEACEAIRAQY